MKFLASAVCIFVAISMVSAEVVCPMEQDDNSYVVQLPSPTSCEEFYKCDRGIAFVQACARGLHYNPRKQVCDYPSSARCKLSVKQEDKQ